MSDEGCSSPGSQELITSRPDLEALPMTTTARVDVNIGDRAFLADPYPVYEEIRAAGRVVYNGALNVWMVPGFEDCKRVLGDRGETFAEMNAEVAFWFQGAKNMITVDGDEHYRLR